MLKLTSTPNTKPQVKRHFLKRACETTLHMLHIGEYKGCSA